MGKIIFKKSPVGAFGLGYAVGDLADINDQDLEKRLIDEKYAVPAGKVKEAADEAEEQKVQAPVKRTSKNRK